MCTFFFIEQREQKRETHSPLGFPSVAPEISTKTSLGIGSVSNNSNNAPCPKIAGKQTEDQSGGSDSYPEKMNILLDIKRNTSPFKNKMTR